MYNNKKALQLKEVPGAGLALSLSSIRLQGNQ
jgi:hypothetical protein